MLRAPPPVAWGQAQRNNLWVSAPRMSALAAEDALEDVRTTLRAFRLDLRPYLVAGVVQDVLGFVEDRGGRPVVEAGRLGRGGRGHEGAVGPGHVGESSFVSLASLRATPGGVGRQVEIALPHRVAVRIGAALEVLALGPHWHTPMLRRVTVRYRTGPQHVADSNVAE